MPCDKCGVHYQKIYFCETCYGKHQDKIINLLEENLQLRKQLKKDPNVIKYLDKIYAKTIKRLKCKR